MSATVLEESEADSESEPESGTMVRSDTPLAVRNGERLAPDSDFQVDPKEAERLCHQDVVAQMLQDLQDGKTPHDWSEETSTDQVLNQLNYKNFPEIH